MSEFKKAESRIKILKNLNETLQKEKDKISYENKVLQKDLNVQSKNYIELEKEKKVYIKDNRMLSNENINLKKEVEKLKPLVDKLTLCSNKLELLLKDQKDSRNKVGIGFNSMNKNEISATKFVPSITSTFTSRLARTFMSKSISHAYTVYTKHTYVLNSKIICYACHKIGHKANHCNMLKRNSHLMNKMK